MIEIPLGVDFFGWVAGHKQDQVAGPHVQKD